MAFSLVFQSVALHIFLFSSSVPLSLSYQIFRLRGKRETEDYVPSTSDPNSSNLLSSQERLYWAACLQVTDPHS